MRHPKIFALGAAAAILIAVPAMAAAAARAPARPAARAAPAQPAVPAPDLSGVWVREGEGIDYLPPEAGPSPLRPDVKNPETADLSNAILKPWAIAVLERTQRLRAGSRTRPAGLACRPLGVPFVMAARPRFEIVQPPRGRAVTFRFEQDPEARTVNLAASHPQRTTPSRFGDSIGRYEGGVFIVDTIAQTQKTDLDRFGTPHTEALRVVERYRLIDDGARLENTFTVEDSKTFTAPWSGIIRWKKSDTALEAKTCDGEAPDAVPALAEHAP